MPKRKPYVCSNMRGVSAPGIMHAPEGVTKEQLEAFFGRKLYEVPNRPIYMDIIKVQPMPEPLGLIFYMDYKYDEKK